MLVPLFASSVLDTDGKFAAGVNDTGGKIATGVVDYVLTFETPFW